MGRRPEGSGRKKGTKNGAGAAQPQPFTAFAGKAGKVGVRIGKTRWFLSADEVIVSAAPVRITLVDGKLQVSGEGCVRQHKTTIAVTA